MGYWFDWDEFRWIDKSVRPPGVCGKPPQRLSPLMQKITGVRTMGELMKLAYSTPDDHQQGPEPNARRVARQ